MLETLLYPEISLHVDEEGELIINIEMHWYYALKMPWLLLLVYLNSQNSEK